MPVGLAPVPASFGETLRSWLTSRLGCAGSLQLGLRCRHSHLHDTPPDGGVAAELEALAVYGGFDEVQDSCRILQVGRRVLDTRLAGKERGI